MASITIHICSTKIARLARKGIFFIPGVLTFWCIWGIVTYSVYYFPDSDVDISKPFLMQPQLDCTGQSPKSTIITVISKASNMIQRDTIRQTWGSAEMQLEYNFTLYFLLGTEKGADIAKELRIHGDVIQADIVENYFHLTAKTVEAFKWMKLFCHKADYFLKIDDDVFFDLEFLKEVQGNKTYIPDEVILGDCVFNVLPDRSSSKYGVSFDEYPFRQYPPYCGGPGYMMTLQTARAIYNKMLTTRMFKFEDVYIGIVASKLGFSVKGVKYFVHLFDKKKGNQDFLIRCSRVTHHLTPEDILFYWDEVRNSKRFREDCV
ncbi:beta-1,3-galactosyltransferase 5-like isoform X2 [Argopecten irradians]|uniref:beta-1,3-galactosyltransferase 5-like isoform X2 n=1 Tax=Argopecten irradians TaxID=31199 RepID=UPI0037161E62